MSRPPAPFPIFDAHMHIDPEGRGLDAAREFQKAGGSALMLVCKPPRSTPSRSIEDFGRGFQATVDMGQRIREATGLRVLVAVGPHPAELPRLASEIGLEGARELMLDALKLARDLVSEGRAHAIGEIGRPHFSVERDVWEASNDLMEAGMRAARELGCAVILHTESATPEVFRELAGIARAAGLSLDRAVKHFSPPLVDTSLNHGLFPSVLAGRDAGERALAQGTRFMLETDYLDDPTRPGAVLGPATVPRRTLELLRKGRLTEEQGWRIHSENPELVFGRGLG